MAAIKFVIEPNDKTKVTCPLCTEVFKVPKILPCLHTFCERCIRNFFTSKSKGSEKEEMRCPSCRSIVKSLNLDLEVSEWINTLPHNDVIELMTLHIDGKNKGCEVCIRLNRTSIATTWCTVCEESLCKSCNEVHSEIKPSRSHRIIPISETARELKGFLDAISENCSCSNKKRLEHFCLDHHEYFCCVCLHSKHKKCDSVKSIDDILKTDKKYTNLSENLSGLKDTALTSLQAVKEQKARLNSMIENTEHEASTIVECIKCKLNDLHKTFGKNLKIFHEEENTQINVRMRLLEQLVKSLEHWIEASSTIKDNSFGVRFFVLVETVREQIHKSIKEIVENLKRLEVIDIKLIKVKPLLDLETTENILSFETKTGKMSFDTKTIQILCKSIGVVCNPSFEDLNLKHYKTIEGREWKCGVCLDNKYMIVGNAASGYQLNLLDIESGSVIHTTKVDGDIKRVCYDPDTNQAFVSCYSQQLYRLKVQANELQKAQQVSFNEDYVGGMCLLGDYVFIVVDNYIKRFPITAKHDEKGSMVECFPTNTECGLNGIDVYDGKLFYTTRSDHDEIKCASLDGVLDFCYKSVSIKSPKGLVVLPSGLVIVMDTQDNGKLHLLSADGKRHRTLRENFENVKNPEDIWLDCDKETIFVCGQKDIDIYKIESKS